MPFLFILLTFQVHGQFRLGKLVVPQACYIFEVHANVFFSPTEKSEIVAVLPIGTAVTIKKSLKDESEKRGYATKWYEISFQKDGQQQTGFVWGGSLAALALPSNPDEVFLLGVDSYNEEEGFLAKARLVKMSKIVSEIEMEAVSMSEDNHYEYTISGEKIGARGFTNLQDIYVVHFGYPACGYPSVKTLIFWDGKTLSCVAQAQNLIEAGVVSIETEIQYPDQTGNSNYLLLIETTQEFENDNMVSRKIQKRKLTWDGLKLKE